MIVHYIHEKYMDTTIENTINVKLPKANAMNIKNSQFGTKACYLITGNKKKTPKVVVLYLAWYRREDVRKYYRYIVYRQQNIVSTTNIM